MIFLVSTKNLTWTVPRYVFHAWLYQKMPEFYTGDGSRPQRPNSESATLHRDQIIAIVNGQIFNWFRKFFV
jgi:hypothetical protein